MSSDDTFLTMALVAFYICHGLNIKYTQVYTELELRCTVTDV